MAALPSDAASAPPDRGATAPDAAATAIADRNVAQLTRGIWLRSITGLLLIAILATANFLILHDVLSINSSAATLQRPSRLRVRRSLPTHCAKRRICC